MKDEKKNRIPWVAAAAAAVILGAGLYNGLAVRQYTVSANGKLSHPIRIALITDLHSCRYGAEQRQLIRAIDEHTPDLILLGGDFFDDKFPPVNARKLLDGICGRYPVYYVTGNHEYRCEPEKFRGLMEILEEHGVRRLSGERITLSLHGTSFDLCGVDDPDAFQITARIPAENQTSFWTQLDALSAQSSDERFSILLSHRPEFLQLYAKKGFDLVLSGHAHGGQWRIPGLMNGFYAPNQGMFPPYAGGEYREGGTTMIVSRGLARETTHIPRFFNRPELVFVDLI